jgi:hypothetical protein
MLSIFVGILLFMDIQLFVVGLVGAASVFYLVRRYYLLAKGKKQSGCEKCGLNDEKVKS